MSKIIFENKIKCSKSPKVELAIKDNPVQDTINSKSQYNTMTYNDAQVKKSSKFWFKMGADPKLNYIVYMYFCFLENYIISQMVPRNFLRQNSNWEKCPNVLSMAKQFWPNVVSLIAFGFKKGLVMLFCLYLKMCKKCATNRPASK